MITPIGDAYEILERITDGFFALDEHWNFTYVNPEAARLLNGRKDLVGKNVWVEFPEAIDLPFFDYYQTAVSEKVPVKFDAFFPPLRTWFDVRAYPSLTGLSVYFQDITDRKITLEQKEQHYRSLFEQNPDAVFSFDLDGNYLSVNPAMEKLLGRKEQEFLHKSFVPFIYKEDLVRTIKHYKMAAQGTTQRYHTKVIHNNGSIIHLDVTNMPIMVEGEIVGVYGIAKDITEWQAQQVELRKTRERLESFIRDNADAIWVIDRQGRVLEINPKFETMFGWSADDVVGEQLPIVPDYLKDNMEKIHERVKTGVSIVGLETSRLCRDGSLLYVSATLSPIVDVSGSVIGITGICRDITLRKQAEETLKAKTKQLESFIENNVDAILIFSEDSRVVHVNKAFENTFGWTKDEIIGVQLSALPSIPLDAFSEVQRLEEEVKFGKSIMGVESIRVRKDGVRLNVTMSISPIHDGQGNPDGWSVTIRDITDWKKSQLMLQNTEKLSLAGQLAAGIAHEIRNPITAIKGFIDLMKSGFEKEKYFDIMVSECERIEQILSELLYLAKPQVTKLERKNLQLLLTQMITLLQTQAIMKNVEIVTEFACEETSVHCDENQIKQVFINFIKNAIEAMPTGGKLTIHVGKINDGKVTIRIIDEGIGMPKEILNKLGQPFYTTKEKGTGLGFMISKNIIENHFGEVHIESEVNVGTTIQITLPEIVQKHSN